MIIEVAGFFNRNPSTLQRLELPTDATTLLAEGTASSPPTTLKVKDHIQIVEASVSSAGHFLDFSTFFASSRCAV